MTVDMTTTAKPIQSDNVGQSGSVEIKGTATTADAADTQSRLQSTGTLMENTRTSMDSLIDRFMHNPGKAAAIVPQFGQQIMIMAGLVKQALTDLGLQTSEATKSATDGQSAAASSAGAAAGAASGTLVVWSQTLTDAQTAAVEKVTHANSLTPEEDAIVQDLKTQYQIVDLDPSEAHTLTQQQEQDIENLKKGGASDVEIQQATDAFLTHNGAEYEGKLRSNMLNMNTEQRAIIQDMYMNGASEEEIAETMENFTLVNELVADGVIPNPYSSPLPPFPSIPSIPKPY